MRIWIKTETHLQVKEYINNKKLTMLTITAYGNGWTYRTMIYVHDDNIYNKNENNKEINTHYDTKEH